MPEFDKQIGPHWIILVPGNRTTAAQRVHCEVGGSLWVEWQQEFEQLQEVVDGMWCGEVAHAREDRRCFHIEFSNSVAGEGLGLFVIAPAGYDRKV